MNKRVLKSVNLPFFNSIPVEWKLKKIKHIAKVGSSKRVFEDQYQSEGIPFFRSKEIVELANNKEISVDLYIEDSLYRNFVNNYNAPQKGDMLITSIGTIGKVWISDGREFYYKDGNITQLTSSKEVEIEFIKYCFQSELFKEQYRLMSAGSTLMALSIEKIKELVIYIPTLNEQKKIIEFLNNKISEVSNIIESKYKLIKLLEQQRQSIITEAVTKGLDPNVKMKDSGVEWIGEIPEHWELSKIGYLGRLQNGISKSSEEFGFGTPFISYGDVYKNEVLPKNASGLVNATEEDKKLYSVNYGDVFFTRTSETIEEIGFASTCLETIPDATFAGFLIRFRPTTNRLNPYFSRFYFRSALGKRYFVKEMNLVTRASLAQGLLRNFTVVLPSLEEQEDIAVYLENKTTAIEESIALIKAQIEKLKEYRQALIYEAVTGKIDVRYMELD